MSNGSNKSFTRDVVILLGVLLVFAVGYFIMRTPPVVPTPPNQMSDVSGHQGMPGTAQLANLPTDYNGLVAIGNQNMDSGNPSIAAECYRRALEIDSSDDNVRVDFGACLHAMGLVERALEEFKTVIKRNPKHAIARFNAGIVYSGLNNVDSARYYIEQYLALEPNGRAAAQAKSMLESMDSSKP